MQLLCLHLERDGGSIKMRMYANWQGGGCVSENFHTCFFNLIPSPSATCNNYQIFSQFHQSICLALFVRFFFIKLDRLIPSKKEATFKRVNIWIPIKISTLIFVTVYIQYFSQGAFSDFFPILLVPSSSHGAIIIQFHDIINLP